MQLPNNLVQLPSCPEFDDYNSLNITYQLGEISHPTTVCAFPRHPKSSLYYEFMVRARHAIKYEHGLLASTNPIRMVLWLSPLPTLYRRGYVDIEYPLSGATFLYAKMFPKCNRFWNTDDLDNIPLNYKLVYNYFSVSNYDCIQLRYDLK